MELKRRNFFQTNVRSKDYSYNVNYNLTTVFLDPYHFHVSNISFTYGIFGLV